MLGHLQSTMVVDHHLLLQLDPEEMIHIMILITPEGQATLCHHLRELIVCRHLVAASRHLIEHRRPASEAKDGTQKKKLRFDIFIRTCETLS